MKEKDKPAPSTGSIGSPQAGSGQAKSETALREEKILEFWEKNEIFKKTLEKEAPNGEFVFYEGPPTANAKPAFHHFEARAFKDVIPRYKTMSGFYVRRKGGWDTHGLPVELQIEKKLGLKSKKEIEEYGVEQFNKQCKESVFEYISDWEKFTDRIGYWVDKKDAYYTFDTSYIESVWNILKEIEEKKLLYKDYKVLPWCPRCGTALSSHELAQGYENDKDLSVTIKFKIIGQDDTYLLAWTTTPWTLPGNIALAVGDDIDYVKIKIGKDFLILAKERLSIITDEYEIVEEMKGKKLIGLKYQPLYGFFSEKFKTKDPKGFEKSYQVYTANFVNTEDGTGIVHTAVMYGVEDFELGTEIGLPKFHLVKEDGCFLDGMDFLSGRFVKDEDVAVDIIKDLASRNLLLKKEKYEHSYPHCWRCNTSLIYYARDSWYIKMSSLRDELVKENKEINWEPEYIKEGRFGEWLREIKDWAISRERYWGTPLPIWEKENGERVVVGSIDQLKKHIKPRNKYFLLRHGQSEGNSKGVISCLKDNKDSLTKLGKEEAVNVSKKLSKEKIDIIISSPFLRTKQTAEIVAKEIGLNQKSIVYDDRMGEIDCRKYESQPWEVLDFRKDDNDIETLEQIYYRVMQMMYEMDQKYEGKTILLVGHGGPLNVIKLASSGLDDKGVFKHYYDHLPRNAEIINCPFVALPHNDRYEIDLHKPYIDQVELSDEKGNKLKRVKEVLDVWFDSGAMPFAQDHYPFSKKELLYPADFISEAIDQTRGWFYTLHAIGLLMGRGKAFKNVICLGHILDAQGKKMSKSIGNIIDPWVVINKYGVDVIRLWMYSVNNPGDSKNFDEKTVDEIAKKVFNPLVNILAFYEMYKNDSIKPSDKSKNVLDRWIISRLNELIKRGTNSLEKYQVFDSARSIRDFINDFSTWYIRRSRDRFKSEDVDEKNEALATTGFILMELVKYMTPFTPFLSEEIYQKIKSDKDPESVNLCDWPKIKDSDKKLIEQMQKAREVVTWVLDQRQRVGYNVRQPLRNLKIKNQNVKFDTELLDIIKDEINVKEIVFDEKIDGELLLDTEITKELKDEGTARGIIRGIQDVRKIENLNPNEKVKLIICASEDIKSIIKSFEKMIQRPTQVEEIIFSGDKQKHAVSLGDDEMSITLKK